MKIQRLSPQPQAGGKVGEVSKGMGVRGWLQKFSLLGQTIHYIYGQLFGYFIELVWVIF